MAWNMMTPEPAAVAEIKPSAKPAHCANVKPNKIRVIIGLVGSKSGRRRIPYQAYCTALLQESQIK